MNKKFVVILLFVFALNLGFAEDILISPILVQDYYGKELDLSASLTDSFVQNLQSYWFDGVFDFIKIEESEYGKILTVLDARNVCAVTDNEYVLYGYIQKNDNSWFGNLKLYSKSHKKVIKEFFACDSILSYDRFLDTITNNVAYGLKEVAGLESAIKKDDTIEPFSLALSLSGLYWNPIDSKWKNVYTGLAGGQIGLEIFPPHKRKTSCYWDTSFRLQFEYLYGKGIESNYPLNIQTGQVLTSFITRFHFNKYHAIYLGCGAYYEMEFLSVIEKYKDEKQYVQNMFGIEPVIGYEITANKYLSFAIESAFDFHLSDDQYVAIKPSFLMNIFVFRGK